MYLELDHLKKHFDGREVVRGFILTLEQGPASVHPWGVRVREDNDPQYDRRLPGAGQRQRAAGMARTSPVSLRSRACDNRIQSYGLFPHMTVLQNVILRPEIPGSEAGTGPAEGMRYLEMVGLEIMPRPISRKSAEDSSRGWPCARALIVEPKLCLLDEPFCNLDAALRTRMRHELKRLQKDLGLTMVFVTHDQEEAIILADRIAIMDQGELVQNDAPGPLPEARPACLWLNSWI